MSNESLELSLLSLFSVICFFSFFLIQKFSFIILKGSLRDDDFNKPQAFHSSDTPRSGGLASIISFLLFIFLNKLLLSSFYADYLTLAIGLFLIGFLEDIKIRFSPKSRLITMAVLLFLVVNIFSLQIKGIDMIFFNYLQKINIFSIFFVVLCFLFIINGANLIDGFNGLLALHLILINAILLYINVENNYLNFSVLITAQIIILLVFLLFNFPNAKIFMGDGGAYLFGSITALNAITTNNLNTNVSSFFFCILLFYLFFEVFFSFFRKIYQNKSPVKPDNEHLHMLVYKVLKLKKSEKDCNYLNSLIINLIFCFVILPSIFLKDNGLFCKIWFLALIIIYLFTYFRLNSFLKKQIDI